MDIFVEGQCLIIKGEREVKRGSNVSKRVFNQKFDLPAGAEVDKITSEYKLDGKLIVSVPAAASQQAAGKTISFRTSEIMKIHNYQALFILFARISTILGLLKS